jgi:hypothetical protein
MRSLIVVVALIAGTSALVNTPVFGQECLRPEMGQMRRVPQRRQAYRRVAPAREGGGGRHAWP